MRRSLKFQILFAVVILLPGMQGLAKTNITGTNLRVNELVELVKQDPTLKFDIRYATKNNFLHKIIYKEAKAFLQKPIAEALVRVQKKVKKDGYSLLIFDGYRPWSVTKLFWDEIDPSKRKFIADPKTGSIHNRGCAVDLSLFDLKTEKEVKMPSEYDTFNESAYSSYSGGTKEEKEKRDYLISVMREEGFTVHPNEWWHFDHKDCDKYEILDLSFDEITSEDLSVSNKAESR